MRLTTGGADWACEVLSDDSTGEAFSSSVALVDTSASSATGSSFTSSEQALGFGSFLPLVLGCETCFFSRFSFLPNII